MSYSGNCTNRERTLEVIRYMLMYIITLTVHTPVSCLYGISGFSLHWLEVVGPDQQNSWLTTSNFSKNRGIEITLQCSNNQVFLQTYFCI